LKHPAALRLDEGEADVRKVGSNPFHAELAVEYEFG
jgi:hypothetical protein